MALPSPYVPDAQVLPKQHDLIVLPDSTHWPRDKNADYLNVAQRRVFARHQHPEWILPSRK